MKKINSDWKTLEKITAILEKFIAPDSKVEHNVYLPVIGRPERKPRQCDVVIKIGNAIRQSLAIVEVQKRNNKPELVTFHGWLEKMREVGAQQLICVSKMGYPKSIIDEVKNKYGGTVTLMTLKEFDYLQNPEKINVLPYNIVRSPAFDFLEIGEMLLTKQINKKGLELNTTENLFSFGDGNEFFSISEFVGQWLNKNVNIFQLNQLSDNCLVMEIDKANNLFFSIQNERIQIASWALKIKINITQKIHKTTVTNYTYRQEFIDGTIAWVASTNLLVGGKEKKIDIVFKTNNDGFLTFQEIIQD